MDNPIIEGRQPAFSLEIADNNVAWVKIDVAGEKMNSLQASFAEDFADVLGELKANNAIKGLVVYSGKPDNFVVGADVRMLDACGSAEDAEAIARKGQEMFGEIEKLPFHVVAAIHGPALGGGLELALAATAESYRTVMHPARFT